MKLLPRCFGTLINAASLRDVEEKFNLLLGVKPADFASLTKTQIRMKNAVRTNADRDSLCGSLAFIGCSRLQRDTLTSLRVVSGVTSRLRTASRIGGIFFCNSRVMNSRWQNESSITARI